jgi:raffinose/stachyose/melibiose transport system permease protein
VEQRRPAGTRFVRAANRGSALTRSRRRMAVIFMVPALLLYVVFYVGPALATVWISLHEWIGGGTDFTFIGFGNYLRLVHDPAYIDSFSHTILILFGVGAVVFFMAFLFTAALRGARLKKTLRALIFLPLILPGVALGVLSGLLLDPNLGLLDVTLRAVHLGALARPWLGPDLLLPTVMVALSWIYTGFYTTILLAGVDSIPRDYYEASEVEGANRLQQFFYVTLPLIWDVVSVAGILWVINAVKTFDYIWALTAVGTDPPRSIWTLSVQMYLVSLGGREPAFDLGYGSAIAVTMVLLVAILVFLLRRLLVREAIEL